MSYCTAFWKPPSVWTGNGAEHLGLAGEVNLYGSHRGAYREAHPYASVSEVEKELAWAGAARARSRCRTSI